MGGRKGNQAAGTSSKKCAKGTHFKDGWTGEAFLHWPSVIEIGLKLYF